MLNLLTLLHKGVTRVHCSLWFRSFTCFTYDAKADRDLFTVHSLCLILPFHFLHEGSQVPQIISQTDLSLYVYMCVLHSQLFVRALLLEKQQEERE